MFENLFKKENNSKSNNEGKNDFFENYLLTPQDFNKILPYLKNVVNIELKKHFKKREILIEYSDGTKKIGNLDLPKLTLTNLKGLTSIAEYFGRGKYGENTWRGNCSGLLIKDLLEHFKPNFVIDPMCGSGTILEVCKDLNIKCLGLDLNPKFGAFDCSNMELPRSTPFAFWHPPYYVFEGSKMPMYSGVMWGNKANLNDGSHIHNKKEYIKWLNRCQFNIYQALRKNGRLCLLIGDSKFKGDYFSPYKEMNIYGDIENVIIKRQYNCISDSINYRGKIIPIEHEYLVIIKKNHEFTVHCMVIQHKEVSILNSSTATWRAIIQSAVEYIKNKQNKRPSRKDLLELLKNHPKAANNNHLLEKIRQTINRSPEEFIKFDDGTIDLVA